MTKRILIFAYYSFSDPVFQSAVLPYFKNFPEKEQFTFILLTFEQSKYKLSSEQKVDIKRNLKRDNIIWHSGKWHSGRFKMLKKVYDTLSGFFYSLFLIIKYKCRFVYSEGFPGAVIAHYSAALLSKPHIIHTYEPHADYMVEGGVWKANAWEARWLRYAEWKVGQGAHTLMTATQGFIEKLRKKGIRSQIIRVPSCVDTQLFQYYPQSRVNIRKQLGLNDDNCVIIYIGKIGGMYWEQEIFDFFRQCLLCSDDFYFLFFSPDDLDTLKRYAGKYGIPETKITFGFLKREEVPHYLSASDFGFVPVKQYPSKRYCSPIKDGEYWACGLPVIIPEGVSDDYLFAKDFNIGLVIDNDTRQFPTIAKKIIELHRNIDREQLRHRCRDFILSDRDIKKYQTLYAELFNKVCKS